MGEKDLRNNQTEAVLGKREHTYSQEAPKQCEVVGCQAVLVPKLPNEAQSEGSPTPPGDHDDCVQVESSY